MKLALITFLAFTTLSVLVSCGKDKEEMRYSFVENNCATGEQKVEGKEAYCARLKDHAANQNCAFNLRQREYEAKSCGSW